MTPPSFNLVFCTNIWNHYQASVCAEFVSLLGEDRFKLGLFDQVYEEQRNLGWTSKIPDHKWILGPPSSISDSEQLCQMVCDADVAVLGQCPQNVKSARAATGKLTFVMSERLFKKPFHWWRMLNPRYARGIGNFKKIANLSNIHYLPMGSYAAGDVQRIGAYGDRLWNWAYFAEVASHPPLPRSNEQVRILWVGRMLDLKRVDLVLKAVAHVQHDPGFGRLDIVGTGPEKSRLLTLARKLRLGAKCVFHEPVGADHVREMMRQADIYILSSNRYEGWGVVVNEAMSEGAVVVANEQAGASSVLVDHGRTGFLFHDNDPRGLIKILQTLIADKQLRETVRQSAWQEMQRLWHPRVGAERLVALSEGLLGLAPLPAYSEGPCRHIESV